MWLNVHFNEMLIFDKCFHVSWNKQRTQLKNQEDDNHTVLRFKNDFLIDDAISVESLL